MAGAALSASRGFTMYPHESNREVFDQPEVVQSYSTVEGLADEEEELLGLLKPNRILDLGVGTGRTTPHLARDAELYVGLDYAPQMAQEAKRHHPSQTFVIADAARLSCFRDQTFDLVVFSYNGIDYLHPDGMRLACLGEVRRLLVEGGHFLFSTHRPRPVLVPPSRGRGIRRMAVAGVRTVRRFGRLAQTSAFWRGHGYVLDPARGGLLTHTATPRVVVREIDAAGLRLIAHRSVGGFRRLPAASADWEYYLVRRT